MTNNKNGQSAAKQIVLKPIKNWEDLYKISNNGDVYSIRSKKYLKPRLSMDGYKRVALYKDGKSYEYRIARLVAETFVENSEDKPQVNHKDIIEETTGMKILNGVIIMKMLTIHMTIINGIYLEVTKFIHSLTFIMVIHFQ